MTFAEKLKGVRKQAGMSQEQLAERLGVSRQAVTKWETDAGIPDIENIMAISALFGISIDELLSNGKIHREGADFLFESVTEYDIDETKRYDMNFGAAKRLVIRGYGGQKLRVRLASNTLPAIQSDFKVKIDDGRKHIDAEIVRKKTVTQAAAKEALTVFVSLPEAYLGRVEVQASAGTVEVSSLECEGVELDIRTENLILDGVNAAVEIDCSLDMNIICRTLGGSVALNQLSSNSRIHVPESAAFRTLVKGIGTSVSYERDGRSAEPFCLPGAENVIELNGVKAS